MKATIYREKRSKKICVHKKFGGLGAHGEFVTGRGYWHGSTYYKRTGVIYEGKPCEIKIDQDIINRMIFYVEGLWDVMKGRHPETREAIRAEIDRVEKFINQYK